MDIDKIEDVKTKEELLLRAIDSVKEDDDDASKILAVTCDYDREVYKMLGYEIKFVKINDEVTLELVKINNQLVQAANLYRQSALKDSMPFHQFMRGISSNESDSKEA